MEMPTLVLKEETLQQGYCDLGGKSGVVTNQKSEGNLVTKYVRKTDHHLFGFKPQFHRSEKS